MRHSDILVVARSSGGDFRRHKGDGARVECARPDECAIRREGRQRLRAGSESAGVAHGSLRQQGNWCAACKTCCQSDDRKIIARARFHQRNRAETFLSERSGVPLFTLRRPGYLARAGDEIDRRSDGHGYRSRSRLCKIANGCTAATAEKRKSLYQRQGH